MKFNSAGPVSKNGPKFWSAPFPQIWSPLIRGPALHASSIAGEVPYSRPIQVVCWKGGDQNFGPWNCLQRPDAVSKNLHQNFDRPLFNTQFDSPLSRGPALQCLKHCGGGPLIKGLLGCVLKRGRSKFWPMKLLTASGRCKQNWASKFWLATFQHTIWIPLD